MFDLTDKNRVISDLDDLADTAFHHRQAAAQNWNCKLARTPINTVEPIQLTPRKPDREVPLIFSQDVDCVMRA